MNACTTPHVEQTKKTDQTCHTYRYRRQVLHTHLFQKNYTRRTKDSLQIKNLETDALYTASIL